MQFLKEQPPSGAIEKTVEGLTSPELPNTSYPTAEYACDPPAVVVALAGKSAMWSKEPRVTHRVTDPTADPSVPVTVWVPATVAIHLALAQLPSGPTVNTVDAVTSPNELPKASYPIAVYVNAVPAGMSLLAGEITRWSNAPVMTLRLTETAFVPSVPVTV